MPGKHRVILDVTSPDGIPDAIRFTGNLFTGHQTGYSVPESDVAIIIVLRHSATAYGYSDAIWGKYGKSMASSVDPAAAPPTTEPYNTGDRMQLAALAKRGVQFMVCGTASRGSVAPHGRRDRRCRRRRSRRWKPTSIPSARLVAAGVVGVTHAQEYGFSYCLYVG